MPPRNPVSASSHTGTYIARVERIVSPRNVDVDIKSPDSYLNKGNYHLVPMSENVQKLAKSGLVQVFH